MTRPRQRPGDGSWRQRPGGWEYRVSFGYDGPRHVQKSFTGRTQAEARRKAQAALAEHAATGRLPEPEKVTLADLLDRWLAEVVVLRSYNTQRLYRHAAEVYLKPALGRVRVRRLRTEDVQRLVRQLDTQGLAPRSVASLLAALHAALAQAVRWQIVTRNVADRDLLTVPGVPRRLLTPLRPAEARALLERVAPDRFGPLLTVVLTLGLRLGEVCGLRWQDVDFESRTIRVSGQRQHQVGAGVVWVPLKSRRSVRALPLPDRTLAALRLEQARQAEHRRAAGAEWVETGLAFVGPSGRPFVPNHVRRCCVRLLGAEASLRVHDLRHQCASLLVALGTPMKVVQEILGHAALGTTADLYAHIHPDLTRSALDQLDQALRPKAGEAESAG